MFTVESESDYFPLQKTASFGETIEISGGSFRIECRDEEWLKINNDEKLYFIIHSQTGLVNYFLNRINVELVSREGSVLKISIVGTNRAKDVDFLNKHIEGFQSISLDKKNAEAKRRIQFIDDQLVGISDSLCNNREQVATIPFITQSDGSFCSGAGYYWAGNAS